MTHFNNITKKNSGFTIVELLVVIVVIGILAAITIVSYTGITAKANTASAQSEANAALAKVNVYGVDSPYSIPTSYGSITGAASTASYYASNLNFSTASNNTVMAAKPATPDTLDFSLCGTGSAAAATSYATITVPTGITIGYWDQGLGSRNATTNTIGTVTGNHTNGYAVTCYKVGIAEAAIAVAKAIQAETGTWPATAAAIAANTAAGAKLPPNLTVGIVAPTTGNGTTVVKFECGSAVAATSPCNNTGGRIAFWDYSLGTPAVAYVTFGTSVNFWTPAS